MTQIFLGLSITIAPSYTFVSPPETCCSHFPPHFQPASLTITNSLLSHSHKCSMPLSAIVSGRTASTKMCYHLIRGVLPERDLCGPFLTCEAALVVTTVQFRARLPRRLGHFCYWGTRLEFAFAACYKFQVDCLFLSFKIKLFGYFPHV